MKKIKNKHILIIITAVIFFIVGYSTQDLIHKKDIQEKTPNQESFTLFWDVWNILENKYPFKEPSESEKRYDAIKGLVASYNDDYSVFFTPKNSKQFRETVTGKFGGAGMEIAKYKGYLIVISPLKDSPAEKAGFLPGDIITSIGDLDTYNVDMNELISIIRGKPGTVVKMTVVRDGEESPIKLALTRDIIKIPVLDTKVIDDVFIISLYNFNQESENDFNKAIIEFKESGLKNLILDLRNNPGGYMSSSIDIASYFIDQGNVVVREDFGDSGKKQVIHRSKGFDLLKGIDYKLAVLINRGSASASEIVAGALQDNGKAIIVGEKSFGKGSVQELINLSEGTSLKVTIAKWLTPRGNQISKKGIIPDFNIDDQTDPETVLHNAINLLKSN